MTTFKAISSKTNQWVTGDLLNLHDGSKYIVNNQFGACIDDKGNFLNTEEPFVHKIKVETLCESLPSFQLVDGTLIYNNDLVEGYALGAPFTGTVVYNDKMCLWYIDSGKSVIPFTTITQLKVLGNLFDEVTK